MTQPSCLSGGPVQIAYGVTDVHVAAQQWVQCGAGPFFVREHIAVTDSVVFDEPRPFDHSSAYGQWGTLMVELVSVHSPPELAVAGLHHMAWFVDSFDEAAAELTAAAMPAVMTAVAGSNRFAFHDARSSLGHFVEIYEGTTALRGFYDMVAASAKDWDGVNPVRSMD